MFTIEEKIYNYLMYVSFFSSDGCWMVFDKLVDGWGSGWDIESRTLTTHTLDEGFWLSLEKESG